jgi:hypothetical protein
VIIKRQQQVNGLNNLKNKKYDSPEQYYNETYGGGEQ